MALTDKLTAIADKIRYYTGLTEKMTLDEMVENEQKVYDAGYSQSELDFWNAIQANGNRTNYQFTFANTHYLTSSNAVFGNWDESNLKPIYPIRDGNGNPVFSGVEIPNFKEHCEKYGITFDFSESKNIGNLFRRLQTTHIPDISVPKAETASSVFYECSLLEEAPDILNGENITTNNSQYYNCGKLVRIPRIWANGNATFDSTFRNNHELVDIDVIEGEIGYSGISFAQSKKLSHDTLMRIINKLKDFSSEGGTHSLVLGATNLAKLTDAEKAIATQKGWTLA